MSGVYEKNGVWYTACGGPYESQAAAEHYAPLCEGKPLSTVDKTAQGAHSQKGAGVTPQLALTSPLSAWLGVSTAATYDWPFIGWQLWLDLVIVALAVLVVLVYMTKKGKL